jgi:hypothetical protein
MPGPPTPGLDKPPDLSIKGSQFAFMFCPLLYRLLDRADPDF